MAAAFGEAWCVGDARGMLDGSCWRQAGVVVGVCWWSVRCGPCRWAASWSHTKPRLCPDLVGVAQSIPPAHLKQAVGAQPSQNSRQGNGGAPRAVRALGAVRQGGCGALGWHFGVTLWHTWSLVMCWVIYPLFPSLFNRQDDALGRRAPAMLFPHILCLTQPKETTPRPAPRGFPAISVPERGFGWESSQIAGCS